ncbi:MAG: PAS domain S-box protein [Tepidisphaeraceae bacterium]
MATVLQYQLDILLFGMLVALGLTAAAWRGRKLHVASLRSRLVLATATALAAVSAIFAYRAGEAERSRLVSMVSGLAPTYALELDRAGQREVTLDAPPTDPKYIALVELQKTWLSINPSVADIYTYRKNAAGKVAFCVDSETDYDHDGQYLDEREQRTPIGELSDNENRSVEAAFAGQASFQDDIYTDRWGSWVSANQPMVDDTGNVYAVLAVDFPAESWISSIIAARRAMLLVGGVTVAILITTAHLLTLQQAEVARRRLAEEAYRDSEARLRTIIDNEPECVMVIDATTGGEQSGRILEINPAGLRMLGGNASRVVGKPVSDFVHPNFAAAFHDHQSSIRDGQYGVIEFPLTTAVPDASRLWIETHSVPLRDGNGRVVRMLSVARDVTARKQVETEKEQLQKQLVEASRQAGMAEIATGVLHNVGNVLNSVNVSAQLVADRIRASRLPSLRKVADLLIEQRPNLAQFVTADERGKALPDFLDKLHDKLAEDNRSVSHEIGQLIDGIEHIKQVVRMQQSCASNASTLTSLVDPRDVMEDALEVTLMSMERHKVELTRHYDPNVNTLPLDKHKVLQILINLISNAKQATCHPEVHERKIDLYVRLANKGASVEYAVKDNGVGITPEVMAKLFRHGFTTRSDGHGFGLHSSANAAREMGGELTAASEGAGAGATFTLRLPLPNADVSNARRAA